MDTENNFKERIRKEYERLTPGFRRLADFLTEKTVDAAFLTATELARHVGVDPATVVRFSQELGYSGYRELSREIKAYVRDQVKGAYERSQMAEGMAEMLEALVEYKIEQVQRFFAASASAVAEAVSAIVEAKRLWAVAEGATYHMAAFAAKRFGRLGYEARCVAPSMAGTASSLLAMGEGDVMLAIVQEGPGLDVGYALHLAKEKGVKTICISSRNNILAARETDILIHVPSDSPVALFDFSTEMVALSLLWEAVGKERKVDVASADARRQEMLERLFKQRLETGEYEIASAQKIWEERLKKQEGEDNG